MSWPTCSAGRPATRWTSSHGLRGEPGPGGAPVLDECENWFAARILDRIPAGDHCAYLLEPTEAHGEEDETPFTFHRARRIEPGHEA